MKEVKKRHVNGGVYESVWKMVCGMLQIFECRVGGGIYPNTDRSLFDLTSHAHIYYWFEIILF